MSAGINKPLYKSSIFAEKYTEIYVSVTHSGTCKKLRELQLVVEQTEAVARCVSARMADG